MTNEVKEILDDLKYVSNEIKVHIQDGNIKAKEIPSSLGKELRLNNYSAKILLDYITNLQEENEKQHKGFLAVCKEAKDLEQRIDKAVEYIINHTQSTAHLEMDTKSIKQLLDILRGDE